MNFLVDARSKWLTGTALLAALVVIFDYVLKFSGLKIPFPWMPSLKFDFTGIPITLSLLMYGFSSALTTSIVAFLAITARSGDVVGASMKMMAELSTVIGLALGLKVIQRFDKWLSKGVGLSLGVLLRVTVMSLANIVVLPVFYGISQSVAYSMLPLIAVFNIVQGGLTILLGIFLDEAVKRRIQVSKS